MSHPYKNYEENRHGRAVARSRGYKSGGDVAQDKKIIQAAMTAHDTQLHGGKRTDLGKIGGGKSTKRANGGRIGMTAGAESGPGRLQKAHKYQDGGAVDATRAKNRRVGELKMWLQGENNPMAWATNHRLSNQGEKDRRETLNISRKFRKEGD